MLMCPHYELPPRGGACASPPNERPGGRRLAPAHGRGHAGKPRVWAAAPWATCAFGRPSRAWAGARPSTGPTAPIYHYNEHRTPTLCGHCDVARGGRRAPPARARARTTWATSARSPGCRAGHPACSTLWNRDTLAAVDMLDRARPPPRQHAPEDFSRRCAPTATSHRGTLPPPPERVAPTSSQTPPPSTSPGAHVVAAGVALRTPPAHIRARKGRRGFRP